MSLTWDQNYPVDPRIKGLGSSLVNINKIAIKQCVRNLSKQASEKLFLVYPESIPVDFSVSTTFT